MRITPLDVRKQEFRKGMRGLDPEEVYAFLATVADEYELILNDNKALRERLLELDDKVQEYRTMEKTLRDTLLTAERVNVEAKDNARREANIIIKEAQIEAEKALRNINTEAMKLRAQVQQLRGQRDSFLARMKVVAESHLSYIDSSVKDFQREDTDVDADVSEEHLADRPVDRDDLVSPRSPAVARDKGATRVDTPSLRPAAPSPRRDTQGSARPTMHPSHDSSAGADGPDPITMIIDRMKRGQQEILSAGAGAPGYPDTREAPAGTTRGRGDAGARPSTRTGNGNDVTRELNLDEIRREVAAEENVER
jgi:cell division initiation protein